MNAMHSANRRDFDHPSSCPTHTGIMSKRLNISTKLFHLNHLLVAPK